MAPAGASVELDPGGPSETTTLLPNRRGSIFEALRIESHESAEVSFVELFSDLAVVVAIHVLSDTLVDDLHENHDGIGGEGLLWSWFFFRVMFLYKMWYRCMFLTNLCNVYTNNTLSPRHYGSVFGTMVLVVLYIKACQNRHNGIATIVFLFAQIAQCLLFVAEAHSARPMWLEPERYENLQMLSKLLLNNLPVELILLIVVLVCFRRNDLYILWGGLWMIVAHVVYRTYHAYKFDARPDYEHSYSTMMDSGHLHERYGLIMLIFLGELCFAATTDPGDYRVSLCALVTGIGAFLNYFVARVEDRTEAWARSAQSSVQCQHLHLPLFCAVPSMSVAFVRTMESEEHGGNDDLSGIGSTVALGVFGSLFLVLMGAIEALTADPTELQKRPRLNNEARVLVNVLGGITMAMLTFLIPPNAVIFMVPFVTMSAGLILVCAVQKTGFQ